MLEIIAESISDAREAEAGGADRIELISALSEGGLTPSFGLVAEVIKAVRIPVHVMIRPHSRSFCYDRDDLRVMLADIHAVRKLGAQGIVLGALTPQLTVDTEAMGVLLKEADGLNVTFHRAFDETRDLHESVSKIAELPYIRTILTSAGERSVLTAAGKFKELKALAAQHDISLLAGGGVTIDSLQEFIWKSGAADIHMGTGVRTGQCGATGVSAEKVTLAKQYVP